MIRRRTIALLAALLPAVSLAQSTTSSPRIEPRLTVSRAARATGGIRIDGKLDEAAWALAPVTDSFTQIDPDEGKPGSQRTEVRVLYDDGALYVGVRLHDTGPVTGRLGRRDMDLGDSDWFGVMLDSYHDHRTAFGFDVNPAGVRRDEVKTINDDDNSWDPVWEVATLVDPAGWTAEYRIPFSQLRFSGATEQEWGVQFERVIGRNHEYAVSTFIPKSDRGGVPRYGHLQGLRELRAGKRLEVLPYAVQRASYEDPGANPFRKNPDVATSAGVDLLYRMTSNLTLNASINPDFGQVEVDPAVVNLGVYETFFEEKRPFFIEGNEIFKFGANGASGGQLFYTRRIGRTPSLAAPSIESDVPDVTTILGAAKLSGKTGGWSIGVLEAVTAREQARFRTPLVRDGRAIVEPLTNYLAARARRELRGGQTFLGGVLTSVHRDLSTDVLRSTLRSAGYAGGVDFRHEFANRAWAVRGDAELSRVEGSPGAITATQRQSNHFFQRPDAGHLEVDSSARSLSGYSASLGIGKQGGEHWRGELAAALTSPGYEVNDMGFAVRTDRRDLEGSLLYQQNRPGRVLRRWVVNTVGRIEHNYDWERILAFAAVGGFLQTNGYWSVNYGAQRFFPALDDRLTRGGPIATRPGWVSTFLSISSDGRKPVTYGASLNSQRDDLGGWSWSAGTNIGVKSSTRWNLRLGPQISRGYTVAQYVASVPDSTYRPTFGRRYVFAPLHQTSLELETRFNVTFSPRLTLETYAQPLLSSAEYGGPKQLTAPKTYEFVPYAGTVPDRDFNLRSLRGNAVLRWEWRQGSTLYVAWQQGRSDSAPIGDFELSRDARALFRTRPDNIFVLKVNYWLNP